MNVSLTIPSGQCLDTKSLLKQIRAAHSRFWSCKSFNTHTFGIFSTLEELYSFIDAKDIIEIAESTVRCINTGELVLIRSGAHVHQSHFIYGLTDEEKAVIKVKFPDMTNT